MEIVVGLDLRPSSQGALHFARWLAGASARRDERLAVIHVLEEEHLRTVLRWHHLDEVRAAALGSARALLRQAGASGLEPALEVVEGLRADLALAEAARRRGAALLVVGRMARRGEHRVVRLGRVARALVAAPPAPLVVVPPDLTAAEMGDGPVLALTGLDEGAAPACRLAADLAGRLGRPLEVLHAVPDPAEVAPPGLLGPALDRPFEEERARLAAALRAWADGQGLGRAATTLRVGEVVREAMARAAQARSPLMVAGARVLSLAERLVAPGAGRELAALAPLPVVVVAAPGGGPG